VKNSQYKFTYIFNMICIDMRQINYGLDKKQKILVKKVFKALTGFNCVRLQLLIQTIYEEI